MNNLFALKDLLKDKQLAIAVYGQVMMDLKESTGVKKLLLALAQQEFAQSEEILKLIMEFEEAGRN